MRRIAFVVLALALLAPLAAAPARGQLLVHDPLALAEQLIQYAEMLADYAQQYRILRTDVEGVGKLADQYDTMVQNLEHLEDLASANPGVFLEGLRELFWRLQGVVYATDDVLSRFDQAYTPEVSPDLGVSEGQRLRTTLTTVRTLLAGAQDHARASEAASGSLARLVGQLDTADGNLKALQAVGALTSEVATETTRVAEAQTLTANLLAVREADELASREEERLTLLDWMRRGQGYRGQVPRTFTPVPSGFDRQQGGGQ